MKNADSHSVLNFENCAEIANEFERSTIYPEIVKQEREQLW
jgi:hypothetical protein